MTVDDGKDFFISYATADERWAEWIAWQLEDAGFTTALQAWDFRPGGNFVAQMDASVRQSERTIAVLSGSYLSSGFGGAEWAAAFARNPFGQQGALLPVRVEDIAVDGLLGQIVHIDLVGLDELEARKRLLAGIERKRAKPARPPGFPSPPEPAFPPVDITNPYRGLAAFDIEHRRLFFGRERYIAEFLQRLKQHRLACIVGASGSGKSSLARAGVLPVESEQGRMTVVCRPGQDPYRGLARGLIGYLEPGLSETGAMWAAAERYAADFRAREMALPELLAFAMQREGSVGITLLVDQAEELFAQSSAADCATFLRLLHRLWADGSTSVHLCLTLRADFMEQAVQHDALREMLQAATVLLGAMTDDELRAAIVEPAQLAGVRFEAGLPERLVHDAVATDDTDDNSTASDVSGDGDSRAGRLPLLQFALSELWLRQSNGVITHAAYDDPQKGIGGIEGALRRHAEAVYAAAGQKGQVQVRRIFRRLVTHVPGQRDIRRMVPRDELADGADAVVADLIRYRLLTSHDAGNQVAMVEIVHESLIRAWPALNGWLAEHREFDQWREGISQLATRWKHAPHATQPDLLLRGAPLDEAVVNLRNHADELTAGERAFIAAGVDSRRRSARLRGIGLLVTFAILFAAAGFSLLQWLRAEDQRAVAQEEAQRANREADLATARRFAAVSGQVFEDNPGETALAAMVAIDAQERQATAEGVQALRRVLDVTPNPMRETKGPADWPGLQISRDGRVAAHFRESTWNADGDDVSPTSRVHVLAGDNLSSQFTFDDDALATPLFSPDGRWLVSAGFSRHLTVVDVATGATLVDERAPTSLWPAFSHDSRTLFVARSDGIIERRDAPDWAVNGTLHFPAPRDRGHPVFVGVGAGGQQLLIKDFNRAAYLVPTARGEPALLEAYEDEPAWFDTNNVVVAAVARERPLGVTQRRRGRAAIWDLQSAQSHLVFQGAGGVSDGAIDPGGDWLATASHSGKVVLRHIDGGAAFRTFEHGGPFDHLDVSADGQRLATADSEGRVIVWDVDSDDPVARYTAAAAVEALAFDGADGSLLIGTRDGYLLRIEAASGRELARRQFDGAVAAIAVGGERGSIAVSIRASDAEMHWEDAVFIDRDTGRERARLTRNGDFTLQQLDPGGARLATFDKQRRAVEIWDTASAKRIAVVSDVHARALHFSGDGRRLLVDGDSDRVAVADAQTGALLYELGEPGGVAHVVVPPGGNHAITQGPDGTIRDWDLLSGDASWLRRFDTAQGQPRFSTDGRRYVVRNADAGTADVIASDNGQRVSSIAVPAGAAVTLSSDGSSVVVSAQTPDASVPMGRRTAIEVWNVDTGSRTYTRHFATPIVSVVALHHGTFAIGSRIVGPERHARLDIIDGPTGRVVSTDEQSGPDQIRAVAVNGDTPWLLVASDEAVELRDSRDSHTLWQVAPVAYIEHAVSVRGGRMLAMAAKAARWDGAWEIHLHDANTGARIRTLPIGGYPRALAVTADDAHIIVAGEGDDWRGLRVWRLADGALVREVEVDASPMQLFALADPDLVAVRDLSSNLRVWRLSNGQLMQRIAHQRTAERVAVARNAPRALTSSGASLRLWDLTSGGEIGHHVADGEAVSPSLSPDGRQVAYIAERARKTQEGGAYRVAMLWQPQSDAEPAMLPIDAVQRLAFDASGRYLLLQGKDGAFLRVVDVATLRTVKTLAPQRAGKIIAVDSTADGDAVLVTEEAAYPYRGLTLRRHTLRLYALPALTELARTDVYWARSFAIAGGQEIAALGPDQRWRTFDPRRTGVDRQFPGEVSFELLAAPGSERLLAPRYEALDVVDVSSGEQHTLFDVSAPDFVAASDFDRTGKFAVVSVARGRGADQRGELLIIDAHSGAVRARRSLARALHAVHFVANGEVVVASVMQRSGIPTESGESLLHWRWRDDTLTMLEESNPVRGLGVTRDGSLFATAEGFVDDDKDTAIGERRLRLWRALDGTEVARVPLTFNVYALTFSQDAQYLAASSYNEVALIRTQEGRVVNDFGTTVEDDAGADAGPADLGGRGAVFAAAGRLLIVGQESGLFVFDTQTQQVSRLHQGTPVKRMTISDDGRFLATSGDRFITVWNTAIGEAVARLETGPLNTFVFGGENGLALFVVRDHRVSQLVWQSDPLIELACEQFASGDWRNGRGRLVGDARPHRCER